MISNKFIFTLCLLLLVFFLSGTVIASNSSPPKTTIKLVFIHHSVGENWLKDSNGGLGRLLDQNNYFVSDTNYGWGPDGIGDRTDIPNWPEWFAGPSSSRYMQALFQLNDKNSAYTRTSKNPGGENRIIMFKSCFPNSELEGRPNDAPQRQGDALTVGNAKAVYNQLLKYFETRKDKLFIAITAPPVHDKAHSANARAFNNWLVNDWLKNYKGTNVAVFDFYNIMTGQNNHHRMAGGRVEHLIRDKRNTLYYYPGGGDDHPTKAGSIKAAKEFVPLLNYYVSRWKPGKPVFTSIQQETETPDSGPSPDSTPSPAKPAAAAIRPDGNRIDDFDTANDMWEVFRDDANQKTTLSFRLDPNVKHQGSSSVHISYNVQPDSWATFSHIMPSAMDWSSKSGVSFFIRFPDDQSAVTLAVYNGNPDDLKPFDYKIVPGKKNQWQKVSVSWNQFVQPSWAGSGNEKFKPSQAMGIAFALDASKGNFWVDDLLFIP